MKKMRAKRKTLILVMLLLKYGYYNLAAGEKTPISACEVYDQGKFERKELFTLMPKEMYTIDVKYFEEDMESVISQATRVKVKLIEMEKDLINEPAAIGAKSTQLYEDVTLVPWELEANKNSNREEEDDEREKLSGGAAGNEGSTPASAGNTTPAPTPTRLPTTPAALRSGEQAIYPIWEACQAKMTANMAASPKDDKDLYEMVDVALKRNINELLLPVGIRRRGVYSTYGVLIAHLPHAGLPDLDIIKTSGAVVLTIGDNKEIGLKAPERGVAYNAFCVQQDKLDYMRGTKRQAAHHQVTRAIHKIEDFEGFYQQYQSIKAKLVTLHPKGEVKKLNTTEITLLDIINSHLAIFPRNNRKMKRGFWITHVQEVADWFEEFSRTFQWDKDELIVQDAHAFGMKNEVGGVTRGVPIKFKPEGLNADGQMIVSATLPNQGGETVNIYHIEPFYSNERRPKVRYLTVKSDGGEIKAAYATEEMPRKEGCAIGIKQIVSGQEDVGLQGEYCAAIQFQGKVDATCGENIVRAIRKGNYAEMWKKCDFEYNSGARNFVIVPTCDRSDMVLSVKEDSKMLVTCTYPETNNKSSGAAQIAAKKGPIELNMQGREGECKYTINGETVAGTEMDNDKGKAWERPKLGGILKLLKEENSGDILLKPVDAPSGSVKSWSVEQILVLICMPIGLALITILTSIILLCSIQRRHSCWRKASLWCVRNVSDQAAESESAGRFANNDRAGEAMQMIALAATTGAALARHVAERREERTGRRHNDTTYPRFY